MYFPLYAHDTFSNVIYTYFRPCHMGYFSPLSPQALALTMGYRFETSALESLHGSQFTLSTQMITPNYTFITGSVSNTALYTTRQKSL